MRNFLLAGNVAAIAASTAIDKAPAGALGFYYMNNGVPTVDATGKLITGYGQIVMGRASKDGGPIIIPFYNKDFSYSKSTYSAAKTFTAKFTVPEPVIMCDHTVILQRKVFNLMNVVIGLLLFMCLKILKLQTKLQLK